MRSKDVFFLGEQGALYSLTKNKVKMVFSIVSLFFVQVDDIKAVLFFFLWLSPVDTNAHHQML